MATESHSVLGSVGGHAYPKQATGSAESGGSHLVSQTHLSTRATTLYVLDVASRALLSREVGRWYKTLAFELPVGLLFASPSHSPLRWERVVSHVFKATSYLE